MENMTKINGTPYGMDLAQRINVGASALQANPDFYGTMGVQHTTFVDGGVYCGHDLTFAVENQPSRAFKYRGASAAVLAAEGNVVTASTGSHGISVAMAAARAGTGATVHVPETILPHKEQPIREAGAHVVKGGNFKDATTRAQQSGDEFVHPFANQNVREGQGTLGQELVERLILTGQTGHEDEIIIPVAVAGGSHIAGIAAAVWSAKQRGLLGEHVRVVGIQPKSNNTSMRAVERLHREQPLTGLYNHDVQDGSVDALVIGEDSLDMDNLSLLANTSLVDTWHTVTNAQIGEALQFLTDKGVINAESAGALPTAFALTYARRYPFSYGNRTRKISFVLPVSGLNGSPESTAPFHRAYSDLATATGNLVVRQSGRIVGTSSTRPSGLRVVSSPAARPRG